ncbi:hypothetical protein E2C01_098947 [Portunus trituberculatus]|uniref:Uncharacterized protein n=1 Tax=Portunus trituberculatus TaxID=210409 RepID=A0A5B7KFF2_PORTR|nr:hypothetical protein [Portunus trituberculatus]
MILLFIYILHIRSLLSNRFQWPSPPATPAGRNKPQQYESRQEVHTLIRLQGVVNLLWRGLESPAEPATCCGLGRLRALGFRYTPGTPSAWACLGETQRGRRAAGRAVGNPLASHCLQQVHRAAAQSGSFSPLME